MKVIELLTKIANGEESDTITEFEFNKRIWNFFKLQDSEYCIDEWLLNQEIVITKHKKIIEEDKKIKKLDLDKEESLKAVIKTAQDYVLANKINEIIDYLEENKND